MNKNDVGLSDIKFRKLANDFTLEDILRISPFDDLVCIGVFENGHVKYVELNGQVYIDMHTGEILEFVDPDETTEFIKQSKLLGKRVFTIDF